MMKKKELTKELLAGLFFFAGVFLLLMFVLVLGRDKGLAQSRFQVSVLYKNVGGLLEGAPVRLAGVNVGTVDNISFLNHDVAGRRVKVTLNILSKYRQQLEKNLSFTIKTEGILGEKLIEIDVLAEEPAADLTKPVMGEDSLDVQDLAEVFAEAAKSFTATTNQLSQIDLVSLSKVMEDSSESLLVTSRRINEIMDDLQEIAKKSKRLLNRIEQKTIEGNLFKVF
ncbi:MAG: MCE family protein [Candidatus Omnitrophica bacterium]|nr:MCE family protein [Candidatus Omnitrophota bacterium]